MSPAISPQNTTTNASTDICHWQIGNHQINNNKPRRCRDHESSRDATRQKKSANHIPNGDAMGGRNQECAYGPDQSTECVREEWKYEVLRFKQVHARANTFCVRNIHAKRCGND